MTQTAPDSSTDSLCPNPACAAANRAGTRFCAACGTALAGGQHATAPSAPPEPPRYKPAATSFTPVTADTSVEVAMAAEWAFNHAAQALQAMNAEVVAQSPPSTLTAVIFKKAIGSPLRFPCQISVQPTGPASSRIRYSVKVDWSSTFLMLGLIAAVGAFNLVFLSASISYYGAPLLSACALGWAVYDYAIGLPNRLGTQLHKHLALAAAQPQGTATAPAAPAPLTNVTPMPQPVAAEANIPAPPLADDGDIIARIEKLAVLKDKGLIGEAEFERRRAELLDRL